jgi:transposase
MGFLAQHGITPITWPAYSPDLNPIEHLWWHLKKRMYKQYPQYNNLKEYWRSIPGKLIRMFIHSMPRRLAACRKAPV